MKFLVLIHNQKPVKASTAQADAEMLKAYGAYYQDLIKAGVHVGGERLRPESDATRITIRGGKRAIVDGPFAETKEVLGGYFMIECKNREEAIEWAAKCPGALDEVVEVRPLYDMAGVKG